MSEKQADYITDAAAMQKRITELEDENVAMYAAIFEASTLGNNAAGRCKAELQRIARNDAARAMAPAPCEHGFFDWSDCPDCGH